MGMDFKVNEYGEIIREDNELLSLEQKYLKGVPLNIEVRKRLALESQNLQVLEVCLKERAITVRRIVWDNPHLTPEMRMEATRQRLIDKKPVVQPNNPVKPAEELEKNSKDGSGNKGCLWFIIIAGALGALFSYLSGEMWFPF